MRVDHKPIPLIFIGGHKKLNLQVSPHIIHRNENKTLFFTALFIFIVNSEVY